MAHTCLVFGKTGSGKTASLGEAAKYLYRKTGKPGRAIYSDNGGCKPIQGLIDAGFFEVYNITAEGNMPTLLHMLAKGFWPTKLEGGLRPKGVKLVPSDMSGVGFYLWEGLTSSAELMMKFLRDGQVPIGGEAVGKFTIKSSEADFIPLGLEDSKYCANNMKHYDWVQGEMMVVLAEFAALPVENVLISAHEAQGTDSESGDGGTIRGAATVGKAGTAKIGKNVGDYIHYETISKPGSTGLIQTDFRAYYKAHPDWKFPNVSYDCKARVSLEEAPQVEKAFPGGFFNPRDLGKFLELCDKSVEQDTTRAKALKATIDADLAKGAKP